MGGGKETPRQKMIGLMYLVLMALLAMNVSKEIINAFITLNNKLESSIEQVESFNVGLDEEFATKVATLKATGAPPEELQRVAFHKGTNDEIVELTRHICNDVVKRNLYLLISAGDKNTEFSEFDNIEEAIVSDDSEAKKRLEKLVQKVNDLGIIAVDEHHELHGHETEDIYHNPLFHIDDEGYIHIRDLSTYTKKDDYDTPTRLLAGPNFKEIAPEGMHLMDNLHHFRNGLIALIANHPSDTMEDGTVYQYKFDTTLIEDPDFLITESDRDAFAEIVDSIIELSAEKGVEEFVMGMDHRGRLNTLINIFGKSARDMFNEFEGKDYSEEMLFDGDVKYHLGWTCERKTDSGKKINLNIAPNPSHLETVGAIVQGITRAKQNDDYSGDSSKVLPIIVHGDAAIAGQGLPYEIVQMAGLKGYKTGGTIHIVVNNQIGFTTNYLDARTSTYCTDVGLSLIHI